MSTVVFMVLCIGAVRLMAYALEQFGKHAKVPDQASRLYRAVRVSPRNGTVRTQVIHTMTRRKYTADTGAYRRAS
jgi:hypothetical protein